MKTYSKNLILPTIVAVATLIVSGTAQAAAVASDNAGNYTSTPWTNGSNQGTGLAAWAFSDTNSSDAFFFTQSSSGNAGGSSGNIDTGGVSWGMSTTSDLTSAVRAFTTGGVNNSSSLAVGQTLQLSMDNGYINGGGTVGFGLQDAAGDNLLQVYFQGGNGSYTVLGAANQSTAHGYTGDGFSTAFTLTSANTYSLTINWNTGSPSTETITGTLAGTSAELASGISQVRLFNAAAGGSGNNDAFFNSLAIVGNGTPTAVPEPSTYALMGAGFLGLLFVMRKRRASLS